MLLLEKSYLKTIIVIIEDNKGFVVLLHIICLLLSTVKRNHLINLLSILFFVSL